MGETHQALLLCEQEEPGLSRLLHQYGIVLTSLDARIEPAEAVAKAKSDLVVLGASFRGKSAAQWTEKLLGLAPSLVVFAIADGQSPAQVVAAMRAGVREFLSRPFEANEVEFILHKAQLHLKQHAELPPPSTLAAKGLLGKAPAWRRMTAQLGRIAYSDSNVLVTGESGSGKEGVARALHDKSQRREGPFVAINCGALPESLVESELFGYEKGAFTGALHKRPGRVAAAEGGTLFLDEIADISSANQVKILRLLQEKTYEPLGSAKSVKADVRFIFATHRDLEKLVAEGTFREDLYYRINVLALAVPPLRDRREDIPLLVTHFTKLLCEQQRFDPKSYSPEAFAVLKHRRWQGNVRELQNIVERLTILTDGAVISGDDVRAHLGPARFEAQAPALTQAPDPSAPVGLDEQRKQAEKQALLHALAKARDNRSQAARLLGISRRTLYNKLAEFDIH